MQSSKLGTYAPETSETCRSCFRTFNLLTIFTIAISSRSTKQNISASVRFAAIRGRKRVAFTSSTGGQQLSSIQAKNSTMTAVIDQSVTTIRTNTSSRPLGTTSPGLEGEQYLIQDTTPS